MIDDDVKQPFKNLDERVSRMAQMLPVLATKADWAESAAAERLDGHDGRLQAAEVSHDGLDQRVQALERLRSRRSR